MIRLLNGDCLEVLAGMAPESIDACVTDPPYHLLSTVERFAKTGGADRKIPVKEHQYARLSRGFMGKSWDGGDIAFRPETWAAVLRVLKPGAHLVAFGAPKNYHRLACAIEDAGFEVRDSLMWIFGSGFPKSHNLDGDREGWGTALKPAYEPIILARKPLIGTVAQNVMKHGTGAINIDATRIHADDAQGGAYIVRRLKPGATLDKTGGNWRPEEGGVDYYGEMKPGRWPANVVHDGSDEVLAGFPITTSGTGAVKKATAAGHQNNAYGKESCPVGTPNIEYGDTGSAARFFAAFPFVPTREGAYGEGWSKQSPASTAEPPSSPQRASAASALALAANSALPEGLCCTSVSPELSTSETASELSRIGESVTQAIQSIGPRFWLASEPLRLSLTCSHANVAAVHEPTGITTITVSHWKSDGSAAPVTFSITPQNSEHGARDLRLDSRFKYCAKASAKDRAGSKHPTVKPIALMRWLCRLITPPGGTILDPFAGTGTTGQAAQEEGFGAVLIEREAEYQADIRRRLGLPEPLPAEVEAMLE